MVLLSSNFVDWSTASGITNSGDDLNHAPGITSTPSTIMIYRTTCTPSTILIYWITWSKSPTSSLSSNLPVVVPVPAPSSEQPTTFMPLAPFFAQGPPSSSSSSVTTRQQHHLQLQYNPQLHPNWFIFLPNLVHFMHDDLSEIHTLSTMPLANDEVYTIMYLLRRLSPKLHMVCIW
jgi:hypothetical protein